MWCFNLFSDLIRFAQYAAYSERLGVSTKRYFDRVGRYRKAFTDVLLELPGRGVLFLVPIKIINLRNCRLVHHIKVRLMT